MNNLKKIIVDDKIINYISEKYKLLKQDYQWKIPSIDNFDCSGESTYQANVKLKKYFNLTYNECKNIQEQINIAELIIKKWGRIYGTQEKTIKEFIKNFNSRKTFPHKNVSIYSKLYSMIDLDNYAIYDSRVAACLNALQLNLRIKEGYVFNYINGRNNIIGNSRKKIGFTQIKKFNEKNISKDENWIRIEKVDNYKFYLDYINKIKKVLDIELYDIEMILFSDAENQCIQIMQKNNY